MKITVDIPDETAARMLGDGDDAAKSLLELAGYTACVSGRISEFEYSQMLGLEWRLDVHSVMKRLRLEQEASDDEIFRQDMATLAKLNEHTKASKAG
jgi:hypothetical protein